MAICLWIGGEALSGTLRVLAVGSPSGEKVLKNIAAEMKSYGPGARAVVSINYKAEDTAVMYSMLRMSEAGFNMWMLRQATDTTRQA